MYDKSKRIESGTRTSRCQNRINYKETGILSYLVSEDTESSDNDSSWCTIVLNESTVKAKVKHIGAGKFRNISDKNGGRYVGKIVNASDMFHCR